MCVCIISFIYPATCGPKGHGSSTGIALQNIHILSWAGISAIVGLPNLLHPKSAKEKKSTKETQRKDKEKKPIPRQGWPSLLPSLTSPSSSTYSTEGTKEIIQLMLVSRKNSRTTTVALSSNIFRTEGAPNRTPFLSLSTSALPGGARLYTLRPGGTWTVFRRYCTTSSCSRRSSRSCHTGRLRSLHDRRGTGSSGQLGPCAPALALDGLLPLGGL